MLNPFKSLWKIEKEEEEEVKNKVDSFNPLEELLEDIDIESGENLY